MDVDKQAPTVERDSDRNRNRIVRGFPSKGVTILSDRPRKIHDWKKPGEVFTELRQPDASTL